MTEEERKNFNQFVDAYNAYQSPNLPAAAPAFSGYGYSAPTTQMVRAPQQMPRMSINPEAIYDPSVAAAMQILNRPMMIAKTPKMLSDGTEYQRQYSLLKEIAPTKLQQYQKIAPPPPPPSLMQSVGGGGDRDTGFDFATSYDGMGDIERSNQGIPSTQFPGSVYDYGNEIEMSNQGIPGTQFEGSVYDYGNPSIDTNYSTDFMGYDPSQGGPGGVGGW